MHSTPPKLKNSQQPYSKEIMTKITEENWVGFNKKIKKWQAKRIPLSQGSRTLTTTIAE